MTSRSAKLVERLIPESAGAPADINGAGIDGDFNRLGLTGQRALVLITTGAVGAAAAVTLKQATDAAGTGEIALGFTRMWEKDAVADGKFAETAVVGNTFNIAANKLYAIEVDASDLADTMTHFGCDVADPGAATLAHVLYLHGDLRYNGAPANLVDPKV